MKSNKLRALLGAFLGFALFVLFLPSARGDAAADYKSKCASCHAADGSGNTPTGKALKVLDLRSDDVQKKTDADLLAVTTNGEGKMPAYKGKLSDAQIKDLVKFIRDLKK
jgi:cytochrome c6